MVELVLVLPATVFLGSVLPFGILYIIVVISITLASPSLSISTKLHSMAPLFPLLMMMLGAGVGLVSLWLILLFGKDQISSRPRGRLVALLCLLAGIGAAAYWFAVVGAPTHGVPIRTWSVWTLLLSGPVLVSLKYVYVLLSQAPPRARRDFLRGFPRS